MEKKDRKKLFWIFVLLLAVGIYTDVRENASENRAVLYREEIGGDTIEEKLQFRVEELGMSFEYPVEIVPVLPTKEQADEFFRGSIAEIEKDFEQWKYAQNGNPVPIAERYQEGCVSAEWSMQPMGVVNPDGSIAGEEIPEEGIVVTARVVLRCGTYEQIHQFPFEIPYIEPTAEKAVVDAMKAWMKQELQKEGEEMVVLPSELAGYRVSRVEEKSNMTVRMLLLEIAAALTLMFAGRQKKEQEQRKRTQELEGDYPELVSQLTLLLGSGMNIRQAWNIIATRYLDKGQKRALPKKLVYEEVVLMCRRIREGENERRAYQELANRIQNTNYHRLVRLLIGNLEKGAHGLCQALEQESKQAYEQRVLRAKKAGEEASTRMLMPLMLMMIVVMVIVMAPALIDFTT